jgi:hypothetical protein
LFKRAAFLLLHAIRVVPVLPSLLLLSTLLMPPGLRAEPAPYHLWRSKLDGKQVCSQTPLGSGWEKVAGPFRDSQCSRPLPRRR